MNKLDKVFSGEYQLSDVDIKTSTIEARKIFLNLIWEMRPAAVIDLIKLFNFDSIPVDWQNQAEMKDYCSKFFLFHTQYYSCYFIDLVQFGFKLDVRNTPFLAYFNFILKNQSELDDLVKKGEEHWKLITTNPQKQLVKNWALEQFVPDWKTLKLRKDSEWLCKTLIEWSERWNLYNEWCLDFALECLRICTVELIDEFQIPPNYLTVKASRILRKYSNYWREGSAWKSALWKQRWKNQDNYSIIKKIPKFPVFNYSWKQKTREEIFTIENSYYALGSLEGFRRKNEEELWEKFFECYQHQQYLLVGDFDTLTNNLKEFHKRLNEYISDVKSVIEPFTEKMTEKRDGDKHFRWLIENTIQPVKSQEILALKNGVNREAVGAAIKDVSKLIGLTPKKNLAGRPKGAKDSYKRRRAEI